MSESLLAGKVAIVTGAGRGIGRTEAEYLAQYGAKVVVNDIGPAARLDQRTQSQSGTAEDAAEHIRSLGGEALASTDDISAMDGARRCFQTALDNWGRVDIVVNNAGILRPATCFDMSESDWDDVIRVHLRGTFCMTQLAARHWRDASQRGAPIRGRLINTSSTGGLTANGTVNYDAAKAGITQLTLVVAREIFPYGCTANAVAPRAYTQMSHFAVRHRVEHRIAPGLDLPERPPTREEERPTTESNAAVVVYLASDDAQWITGQVFRTWHGEIALWEGWRVTEQFRRPERQLTVDELPERMRRLFRSMPPGMSEEAPDLGIRTGRKDRPA